MVLAILIEPLDGEPGAAGTGLTGLGVEAGDKGIVFGQNSTVALQILLAGAARVHPQAQALVADELHDFDRFINGSVLCLCPV